MVVINADPDAIASAMAVKRLLWRRVAGVTITHVNTITRPDNLAMVRLLGAIMSSVVDIQPSRYKKWVMVDSQPTHHEKFPVGAYTAIIDHHPNDDTPAPFKDIRTEYGAVASMMTEYLRAARIKPSLRLATALFYAIKTDTANFERKAIDEDMRAFQFLFKHANIHLVRKIEQVDFRLDFLEDFKKAVNVLILVDRRIFAHLGTVRHPDSCVLLADFFMRFNLVTWSVVSGVYDEKLVVVVRNDGSGKNAGAVVSEAFGKYGSAGGHRSMARAEIALGRVKDLVEVGSEAALRLWVIQKLASRTGRMSRKAGLAETMLRG